MTAQNTALAVYRVIVTEMDKATGQLIPGQDAKYANVQPRFRQSTGQKINDFIEWTYPGENYLHIGAIESE